MPENRRQLLDALDDIGLKIGHLASQISRPMNDEEWQQALREITELRQQQQEIHAKLEALE